MLCKNQTVFFAGHLSSEIITETSSTVEPPPYSEAPPEYSAIYMSHTSIPPENPVYMQQSNIPHVNPNPYPTAPQGIYNHTQPSMPTITQVTSPPPPVVIVQQINNQPVAGQFSIPHNAPHKALLQPTTTRTVHTTTTGRRRTESHVTDFETGKEYIIKEKTSRHGLHNKTVIKEIGGPRTIVKETPRKTVVRHRRR